MMSSSAYILCLNISHIMKVSRHSGQDFKVGYCASNFFKFMHTVNLITVNFFF